MMSAKLYVGNLSFKTTEEELADLFNQAGTVISSTIIRDRDTQMSRGFGFVEMSSEVEAQNAISQFNGRELNGRQINVNEAREKTSRNQRGGYNSGSSRGGSRGGFNRSGGSRPSRGFSSRREDKGWWNS